MKNKLTKIKPLIFVISLILLLSFSGCKNNDANANSNNLTAAKNSQVYQFIELIYSMNDENLQDKDLTSKIKAIITEDGYQELLRSGALYNIKACEEDFNCKLNIKNITVNVDPEVDTVYNFKVQFSAGFKDGKASEFTQEGQVTTSNNNNKILVDNFYEETPKLYDSILIFVQK